MFWFGKNDRRWVLGWWDSFGLGWFRGCVMVVVMGVWKFFFEGRGWGRDRSRVFYVFEGGVGGIGRGFCLVYIMMVMVVMMIVDVRCLIWEVWGMDILMMVVCMCFCFFGMVIYWG